MSGRRLKVVWTVYFAFSMIVMGACIALCTARDAQEHAMSESISLAVLQPRPVQSVNGHECYRVLCAWVENFTQCVGCCNSFCSQDPAGCIDECLARFDTKGAYKALYGAARMVQNNSGTPQQIVESVALIEQVAQSKNERLKRMSRAFARETPGVGG